MVDSNFGYALSCIFRYTDEGESYDMDKVCKLIDENIESIDFEDEEDVKELIDIFEETLTLTREFSPRDADGNPYGEAGVKILSYFISKGFDINFKMRQKNTLLLHLAETEILPEIFQKVVDLGADAYAVNRSGENILSISADKLFTDYGTPDYETSERLPVYIAEHFDLTQLNSMDESGYTPLMYAVSNNKRKLVETLLKRGVNVDETGGQSDLWNFNIYGVSPFALACRYGYAELAQLLLNAGADETLCDSEGTPAMFSMLFAPVNYEDEDVDKKSIVALLKNPEFLDSDGNTLLIKACTREEYNRSGKNVCVGDNEEIISALLARGVNVNAVNNKGETALINAAAAGEKKIVKMLLEAGADIDAHDNRGNTPLIAACTEYSETTACLLVRKGANFELLNNEGFSAIDIAMKRGYTDFVELCLSIADGTCKVKKANEAATNPAAKTVPVQTEKPVAERAAAKPAEEKSRKGKDKKPAENTDEKPAPSKSGTSEALALACLNGDFAMAKKLIGSADETVCDGCGLPPAFYLLFEPAGLESKSYTVYDKVYQGKQDIVSVLKNIDVTDADGDTLLMKAFQKRVYPDGKVMEPVRNANVIAGLIMRGADVNAVNKSGKRAIHYAAENLPSGFPMLIALGADIDAQDSDGNTALITACRIGYEYDCTLLLSSGADFNIKNKKGETAKDFARKNRLRDVLEMME